MKTLVLLITFIALSYLHVKANCCSSISTGNYENALCWSSGSVPVCGDTIIICAGHTITMTAQHDYFTGCSTPMYVGISGKLIIQTGKKLMLPAGSRVEIQPGGSLEPGGGGGTSNLIDIGGVNVWKAQDGIVNGYHLFEVIGLPIDLLRLEALQSENNIDLTWTTASEKNNSFFTIEKSKDALNFEAISKVKGAGNSTNIVNYRFKDEHPFKGASYYRLSQTDFDGTSTSSYLVNVNFTGKVDFSFKIYPNPNNGDFINVDLTAEKGKETNLKITDINGQSIYSKNLIVISNEQTTYSFYPEKNLSPGIYLVRLSSPEKEYTRKVVVK